MPNYPSSSPNMFPGQKFRDLHSVQHLLDAYGHICDSCSENARPSSLQIPCYKVFLDKSLFGICCTFLHQHVCLQICFCISLSCISLYAQIFVSHLYSANFFVFTFLHIANIYLHIFSSANLCPPYLHPHFPDWKKYMSCLMCLAQCHNCIKNFGVKHFGPA